MFSFLEAIFTKVTSAITIVLVAVGLVSTPVQPTEILTEEPTVQAVVHEEAIKPINTSTSTSTNIDVPKTTGDELVQVDFKTNKKTDDESVELPNEKEVDPLTVISTPPAQPPPTQSEKPASTESSIITPLNIKSGYEILWDSEFFGPSEDKELWQTVVFIKCHVGEYIFSGSGVVLNEDGLILTNNHVLDDSYVKISVGDECSASFPLLNQNSSITATISVNGVIKSKSGDSKFLDLGTIQLPPPESVDDQRFQQRKYYGWQSERYPYLTYPVCDEIQIGDKFILYGWDSRVDDGSLERERGVVQSFVESVDGELFYTNDLAEALYVVTDAKMNPGVSGGLAFNATRECFAGIHSKGIAFGHEERESWAFNLRLPEAKTFLQQ